MNLKYKVLMKFTQNIDFLCKLNKKQGRKRPLDTPKKRMIERREREGERERKKGRKGEI